jgi:hypothetical protein
MNLMLNLPADLEANVKKRAEQAGLDLPAYVLQTLRVSDIELTGERAISNDQLEASLNRLREIHAKVSSAFDDSRESIYEGCGE